MESFSGSEKILFEQCAKMEQIACINFVLNDARIFRELKPIMNNLDLFRSFDVRKFTQKNSYKSQTCLNWASSSIEHTDRENLVALLLLVNPLLADFCLKITTIPRKNITKHYISIIYKIKVNKKSGSNTN